MKLFKVLIAVFTAYNSYSQVTPNDIINKSDKLIFNYTRKFEIENHCLMSYFFESDNPSKTTNENYNLKLLYTGILSRECYNYGTTKLDKNPLLDLGGMGIGFGTVTCNTIKFNGTCIGKFKHVGEIHIGLDPKHAILNDFKYKGQLINAELTGFIDCEFISQNEVSINISNLYFTFRGISETVSISAEEYFAFANSSTKKSDKLYLENFADLINIVFNLIDKSIVLSIAN